MLFGPRPQASELVVDVRRLVRRGVVAFDAEGQSADGLDRSSCLKSDDFTVEHAEVEIFAAVREEVPLVKQSDLPGLHQKLIGHEALLCGPLTGGAGERTFR
jgi:hypothetical protein